MPLLIQKSAQKINVPSGVDERFPVKQISFAQRGRAPFITDQNSPAMACQSDPKPPALVAPVRAGATIEFQWNPWYKSHKGPIVSYMAPYDVPVENIDVNKLEFFKISETGLLKDNLTWAVDEMMANGNKTTAVIPHDIRAGKYVLRHELIALHYATEDSLYLKKADRLLGPQVSESGPCGVDGILTHEHSTTSSVSTWRSRGQDQISRKV